MTWVHRLFALATALPVLAWLLAVAVTLYLVRADPCAGRDLTYESCNMLGMEVGQLAVLSGFYASWGFLILVPVSVGISLAWAVVAIAAALWRRHRRTRAMA